jgi:phosphoglycerate dehydrogenase-like enzyme
MTHLPVLGVPVESKALKGMDSLLSIVQMPGGIPVGTLAIGVPGATNAGLLAASILATSDPALADRLIAFRAAQTDRSPNGRGRWPQWPCESAHDPPGETIGILGGGQLGRMLALAAANLGYRCHVYAPEADRSRRCQRRVHAGRYDDEAALAAFAAQCAVVTYEFENVAAGRWPRSANMRRCIRRSARWKWRRTG